MGNLEEDNDVSVAAKMFDKGEEEYEHLLLDLERLNLGIPVMEAERYPKLSLREENEAHLELDKILERKVDADDPIMDFTSHTRDYDEDPGLMDWTEEEGSTRRLKRKRRSR